MRKYGQVVSLGLLLLLFRPGIADETSQSWQYPTTFESQQVEVNVLNWELTRDKKWLLVHAKLRSKSDEALRFDWRSLLRVHTARGESYPPNYDALVDRNGAGLTRTIGPFLMERRDKIRISIPFLLGDDETPVRLELPDGRVSPPIR